MAVSFLVRMASAMRPEATGGIPRDSGGAAARRGLAEEMTTQVEMIGRFVGDYQVTELLGEGGMGVVFKGLHPTLGQIVAIKMLHPNLVKAESIKQRFLREAQAMARLRHPNILQLYNFIDTADGCFIVMEFVEGKTFEDLLQDSGLIPPDRAIELFVPVLSAMLYAHQQGIIHRDIKPSNLMLLHSGIVKVMDFGTAKMAGGAQLTAAGMTLGTVVYMSPEQLMGRDLSAGADIYSLGVTLYEMTTGRLPFYHENEMELMKMIMKQEPPPPGSFYPAMPKSLERVIMRSIAKDLTKRFRSADEFAKELERVKGELAGGGSGGRIPTPAPGSIAPPFSATPTPPPVAPGALIGPGAAPPLLEPEETQSVQSGLLKSPSPAALSPAPRAMQQAPPSGGLNPLVVVGAVLGGVGILAGSGLMAMGQLIPGVAALAGMLVLGVVLLVVGLMNPKPVLAGMPGGPVLSPPSPSPMPRGPHSPVPPGRAKSPAPADGTGVAGEGTEFQEQRKCPECGRLLLPTMGTCPFCAPLAAPNVSGEETTKAGNQQGPPPESIPTPPGFGVVGQAFLQVIDGAQRGEKFDLPRDGITLGRAPDNHIVLKDPSVSSHHARIDFYQGKHFLSDLQSSNGTFVNNSRVEQTQLKHKDLIIMGGTRMLMSSQ